MFEKLNRKKPRRISEGEFVAKKVQNFGCSTQRDTFDIKKKASLPAVGKYYPKYELRFKRSPNLPYSKEDQRAGEEQARRIKQAQF